MKRTSPTSKGCTMNRKMTDCGLRACGSGWIRQSHILDYDAAGKEDACCIIQWVQQVPGNPAGCQGMVVICRTST